MKMINFSYDTLQAQSCKWQFRKCIPVLSWTVWYVTPLVNN